MELKETFQKVKAASKTLGLLTDEQRNEVLKAVADTVTASNDEEGIWEILKEYL